MPIDPRLLEFCTTQTQQETVQAVIDHGSEVKAAKALNKARGSVSNTIRRIQRNAQLRGYSPEHDLTKVLPPTLMLRGTSTLYHKEKGMMMQWVKTRADEEAQAQ